MIVEGKNLVKNFRDTIAVDNVNISIKDGEIFGLLGPNGAGKTTTINMLLGLVKADGGEIRIFDKSMKSNEMEIKRNIGIVPQDIAVYEDMTAYENVMFFGRLYGLRDGLLKESAEEALNFTGLWERRKDLAKKFSGGMKRRLNIACAIVHKPKLIIMDEPTVGIDPQSRNHILESVKKLNEQGSTIIYTSHYMEEVEELCSYITIMDHGRVIAKGTKEELKNLISSEERVTFEVSGATEAAIAVVKKLSGVRECVLDGSELEVVSEKHSKNLGRIIDAIVGTDMDIVSLNIDKPTLEGVFLTLTGRTLRD